MLEERFPETVDAEPELLARHCTEAGLAEQAVDYWQRAGQQALARSAAAEAVEHLTRGLEVLAGVSGGAERQRRELGLQLALGQASIAARGFAAAETGRAYARARELCRELGDVPELFPALYGRFIVHFQRGELAVAHEAARELLRLAEDRDDAAARVTGHRIVGSALYHLGRLVESRTHLEKGLALYAPERDRGSAFVYALDTSVVCSFWLVHVLFAQGYPDQALARMREALAYARELAHPYTVAYALSVACILHGRHRPGRDARTEAETLTVLAAEQGFPLPAAVGTVAAGWVLTHEGSADEGITLMQRGLADYTATGAELWVPDLLALLAQGHARAGRPAAGLDLLADALDRVGRTGDAGSRPSCTGSGVSCCWPFPSWTRSRPRFASDAPSRSPESRARGPGSCAPRRAWPGCGAARTGRPTGVTCSPPPTAGSPRGSTRQTCRRRRRCSMCTRRDALKSVGQHHRGRPAGARTRSAAVGSPGADRPAWCSSGPSDRGQERLERMGAAAVVPFHRRPGRAAPRRPSRTPAGVDRCRLAGLVPNHPSRSPMAPVYRGAERETGLVRYHLSHSLNLH